MYAHLLHICLLISWCHISLAQQPNDLRHSVQINADYSSDNSSIALNWERYAGAQSYAIYMRNVGSLNWGAPLATVAGEDTTYLISNITIGDLKEYKVTRTMANGIAEGYAYSGIAYQPVRFGSKIIVLTESEIRDTLANEIDRYIADLEQEGWEVSELIVNKDDTAIQVRSAIQDIYNTDPLRYKMVAIIGHVAVPYSGNIGPDGHNNHIGAWPCDGYYGEMNGSWTDFSVNNTTASQSRNHNIPNDGKLDQSLFPSDLELAVGRIDFSNMPLFEEGEIALTRNYLNKNHAFRKAQLKSKSRGIIENNFSLAEGFGQNGYRNISVLLGRDSTYSGDYDALKTDTYLWSYGAGGGNFQGASGISNTSNFTQDSIQSIFTMLFGSYFGDFDSQNNFLRAALATGTVLTNVWAGRPHWHFHPMGMGSTIGDCALLSMNNTSYVSGFGHRQVHMALIGDPSLKMTYVPSPTQLQAIQNGNHVELTWEGADTEAPIRYHVYKQKDNDMPQLLDTLISANTYIDQCVDAANYTYYVVAVTLQEGVTGSYWNESPHISTSISVDDIIVPVSSFTYEANGLEVNFESTAVNAGNHEWSFGDGVSSNEQNPSHTYTEEDSYTVTLSVQDGDLCYTDVYSEDILIMTSSVSNVDHDLEIYPNPVSHTLYINSNIPVKRIYIYNAVGQLDRIVHHQENISQVDLSYLVSGIYTLIAISHSGDQYTHRVTKI